MGCMLVRGMCVAGLNKQWGRQGRGRCADVMISHARPSAAAHDLLGMQNTCVFRLCVCVCLLPACLPAV